jgi:hypothetical protein
MCKPKFKYDTFHGNIVVGFKLQLLDQQVEEEFDRHFIDF